MRHFVCEKDIKFYKDLKRPHKAFGFYSKSKSEFVKKIQSKKENKFNSYVALVPKKELPKLLNYMKKKMEDIGPNMIKVKEEAIITTWNFKKYTLLICTEFGGTDELSMLIKEHRIHDEKDIFVKDCQFTVKALKEAGLQLSRDLEKSLKKLQR